VYRVQALPQSMLPLVWDFGQLSTDVEKLYIRQMVLHYVSLMHLCSCHSFVAYSVVLQYVCFCSYWLCLFMCSATVPIIRLSHTNLLLVPQFQTIFSICYSSTVIFSFLIYIEILIELDIVSLNFFRFNVYVEAEE